MRWAALLCAVGLAASTTSMPAVALAAEPPRVLPGPPPAGPVAPLQPTEQKAACAVAGVMPGSRFEQQLTGDAVLDYTAAWRFSRGAGQKVAVIDTGVARHPRLPRLEGGGDYVSNSDGLVDCDAHGTLVAGLIAGQASPTDTFAGVAPEAAVLSIRQNSAVYAPVGGPQGGPNSTSAGYGNTQTLAYAIVRAVDMGATVINLSATACASASTDIDDAALGQAVRFAFERDVVVVAVAGNVSSDGLCAAQNDVRDPNRPLADTWEAVRTVASPAWFDDYVLSVGALTRDGRPADFSLRGPWVDVAAPGEALASLSPTGPGLMNAWLGPQGELVPVNGTSFAAPFVSGVVALLRSRFPGMSAGEVMQRIERTSRTAKSGPDAATGHGVIDPIAALTYELPDAADRPPIDSGTALTAAAPVGDGADRTSHYLMMSIVAGATALTALTIAVARRRDGR
ncbi:type VII secretion-associated serine protease mycosin [soil metagenome]